MSNDVPNANRPNIVPQRPQNSEATPSTPKRPTPIQPKRPPTQPNQPLSTAEKPDPKATSKTVLKPAPQPKVAPVDVVILGKTYPINCPVDEVDELEAASTYIDGFVQDIRKQAPQLSHDNLLVLCCLNLYEQMQENKSMDVARDKTNEQAHQLIDKMIKDLQMI